MTTKEWLMNYRMMIPYPCHTREDGVDDNRWTENDYVVRSSTEFINESNEWLKNDNHSRQVSTCEPRMRRSRLISCLGQVVIDSMVGMDKDSSSVAGLAVHRGGGNGKGQDLAGIFAPAAATLPAWILHANGRKHVKILKPIWWELKMELSKLAWAKNGNTCFLGVCLEVSAVGGCWVPGPATKFGTGQAPVGVPVGANGWRCS